MRVTLNQDELFDAVSSHLRDKLNLDNTASIEISFTAGRSPKGYTADVDITYPQSDLAAKCKARHNDDDTDQEEEQSSSESNTVNTDATAGGAVPKDNLFNN